MSGTLTDEANVTTSAEDARVFPLPLSDFEYYMLVDDRPTHPMVFVMVVHLTGCLDRTAFQLAVASAVSRHPLFDSVVQPVAGRGWCWVRRSQPGVTIEWRRVSEDAQADSPVTRIPEPVTIRAIDLYHNRGLEIQVDEAETCSRIAFHLHHACCDGIGGLQFIGEILARYGQLLTEDGERSPEFEDTSMAALLLRGKGDGCADDVRRPKKSLMRSLAKAGRLIFRRPVPLTAKYGVSNPAATDAVQPCAIRTLALPRSVSRQLQSLAVHRQVSVNDLLLREMLLQILSWNQACGGISGNPWLRVAVPVSMRTSVHQRMPAANLVSYAFVTRRAADCHDPEQLLDSIHRQTGDVLFNREGLVFLKCIRILRAIPGALRALLGFKSCFCTVVLANVGEIRRRFSGRFPLQNAKWRAGNVIVEQICGVAPVRPNTRAAITVGDYGGQMCLHLRTDASVMSDADSERFLAEYAARLVALTVSKTATDPDQETR